MKFEIGQKVFYERMDRRMDRRSLWRVFTSRVERLYECPAHITKADILRAAEILGISLAAK